MGTDILEYSITTPVAFVVNTSQSTSVRLCQLKIKYWRRAGEIELEVNVNSWDTKRTFMVFHVENGGSSVISRLQKYMLSVHLIFVDGQTLRTLLRNVNHADGVA
jgi:hypothetical protein